MIPRWRLHIESLLDDLQIEFLFASCISF